MDRNGINGGKHSNIHAMWVVSDFMYDVSIILMLLLCTLTHWGRDKMAAVSQTTHSSTFSSIKMLEILLIFHWSLFLRVKSTILHHWFRLWLGADQATSHYLNQWWLDYRRIYASRGLNELRINIWSARYFEVHNSVEWVRYTFFNWYHQILYT